MVVIVRHAVSYKIGTRRQCKQVVIPEAFKLKSQFAQGFLITVRIALRADAVARIDEAIEIET